MKSLSDLDLVLRTERLELAPVAPADAADIWPFSSDPSFPVFMVWEAHKERAETDAFIASIATPASTARAAYGRALRRAAAAGVEVISYRCRLSPAGIWLGTSLPVLLTRNSSVSSRFRPRWVAAPGGGELD